VKDTCKVKYYTVERKKKILKLNVESSAFRQSRKLVCSDESLDVNQYRIFSNLKSDSIFNFNYAPVLSSPYSDAWLPSANCCEIFNGFSWFTVDLSDYCKMVLGHFSRNSKREKDDEVIKRSGQGDAAPSVWLDLVSSWKPTIYLYIHLPPCLLSPIRLLSNNIVQLGSAMSDDFIVLISRVFYYVYFLIFLYAV